MRIVAKKILIKFKIKNKGNIPLITSIDNLISDLENNIFYTYEDLKRIRGDADRVHNNGFFFFNLDIHRTMIMVEFGTGGEATVIWVGTHKEYEKVFRNNKQTIEKWLRNKGWIG